METEYSNETNLCLVTSNKGGGLETWTTKDVKNGPVEER